jgi:hypothetical protein
MRVCAPPARKPAGRGQGRGGGALWIVLDRDHARAGVSVRAAHARYASDGSLHGAAVALPLQPQHRQLDARHRQAGVKAGRGRAGWPRRLRQGQRCLRVPVRVGVELRDAIG